MSRWSRHRVRKQRVVSLESLMMSSGRGCRLDSLPVALEKTRKHAENIAGVSGRIDTIIARIKDRIQELFDTIVKFMFSSCR